MGIEAPEGPGHLRARPHHAAVDVDRQPRQPEPLDGLHDERVVEVDEQVDEQLERRLRELLQPVARAEGTLSWRPLSLSPSASRSLVQELCRRTLLHHHLHASLPSHDRDRYFPPLVPGEQQVDARLAYA